MQNVNHSDEYPLYELQQLQELDEEMRKGCLLSDCFPKDQSDTLKSISYADELAKRLAHHAVIMGASVITIPVTFRHGLFRVTVKKMRP
jgi:hypothetical protein